MKYNILQGDCIEQLRTMAAQSVHTCVTSPPYFGLRDYGHDGQIGLEETPDAYVAKMVEVFREVRRVLRDDGTLWLNLGDSYASSGDKTTGQDYGASKTSTLTTGTRQFRREINREASGGNKKRRFDFGGIKHKDLIGIPWRVALALQAVGWYLRQDIIWQKTNPMPESGTDRCTKAHEYIFLLTKSARYYYDAEAVKEPVAESTIGRGSVDFGGAKGRSYNPIPSDPNYRNGKEQWGRTYDYEKSSETGRNRRSVWTVATQPYSGAHFATFPPDLIRPCILAGCPKECCAKCGAPLERVVKRTTATPGQKPGYTKDCTGRNDGERAGAFTNHTSTTLYFRPTCSCNAGTIPGTVLDPFGGSGTTAQVAIKEGRSAVLIELNPKYVKLAHRRIRGTQMPLF